MQWVFSVNKLKSWIKKVQNRVKYVNSSVNADDETVTTVASTLVQLTGTGAVILPTGNNAARPTTPVEGALRVNTEAGPGSAVLEIYLNGGWEVISFEV